MYPTCDPNVIVDPASISAACAGAAPDSQLANACSCHAQFLTLKKQYDQIMNARKQFDKDMASYKAALKGHDDWQKESNLAQVLVGGNPTGFSPIPTQFANFPSYPDYATWLKGYPEPTIPPEPTHAPENIVGNVMCCAQIFDVPTVPPDPNNPQFVNVMQYCQSNLPCAVNQLSISNTSNASQDIVITPSATEDSSSTTSSSNDSHDDNETVITKSSTYTSEPGQGGTRDQESSKWWVWLLIVGVPVLMIVVGLLFLRKGSRTARDDRFLQSTRTLPDPGSHTSLFPSPPTTLKPSSFSYLFGRKKFIFQ